MSADLLSASLPDAVAGWRDAWKDLPDPLLLAIIRSFHAATGVPMILNTSLNVMSRPTVHDVEDAVGVFLTSDIDVLVLGDALFRKELDRLGIPGRVSR